MYGQINNKSMTSNPPPYSESTRLINPSLSTGSLGRTERIVVQEPPFKTMPSSRLIGNKSVQSLNSTGSGSIIQEQPNAYHQPSAHPTADGWTSMPRNVLQNYPIGPEYLSTFDQFHVKQKLELSEVIFGRETNNKYKIKNSTGQTVLYAVEDNDCCTRNCFRASRPFEMKILDNYKNEIIHLSRPYACKSCLFPCCLQSLDVFSPPGCFVGLVKQDWTFCTPIFSILNGADEIVLKIEGPVCTFSMCGDVNFKILSKDGTTVVGGIAKHWSGFIKEAYTDADFFSIHFPMDLDVRTKAVVLGALFLIDMMFFEN